MDVPTESFEERCQGIGNGLRATARHRPSHSVGSGGKCDSGGGAEWRVEGQDRNGTGPTIEADDKSLGVRSRDDRSGLFDALGDREAWTITLPDWPTVKVPALTRPPPATNQTS